MYVKYPTDQITFYYQASTLFDKVSLRTTYLAKTIRDKNGESMVDDYGMSEDEFDAFKVFAADAVNDAFQILLKMTSGVENAVTIYDGVPISEAEEKTNAYGMKIVDEDAYNDNNLFTVDDGLKKFIEAHVMTSWYNLIGLTEEEIKWLAKRDDIRRDLITNRLHGLRKKKLS